MPKAACAVLFNSVHISIAAAASTFFRSSALSLGTGTGSGVCGLDVAFLK